MRAARRQAISKQLRERQRSVVDVVQKSILTPSTQQTLSDPQPYALGFKPWNHSAEQQTTAMPIIHHRQQSKLRSIRTTPAPARRARQCDSPARSHIRVDEQTAPFHDEWQLTVGLLTSALGFERIREDAIVVTDKLSPNGPSPLQCFCKE